MTETKPILTIPPERLEWKFTHAGGPGGQHVNKVATAVQLHVTLAGLEFPAWQWKKLKRLAGSRLTAEGVLMLETRDSRSQQQNREETLRKLDELLRASAVKPKRRIATRPTKASIKRRSDEKRKRSDVKKYRQKPTE